MKNLKLRSPTQALALKKKTHILLFAKTRSQLAPLMSAKAIHYVFF